MGLLKKGDEELHYSDHSHRWTSRDPDRDEEWRTRLEAHVEEHRQSPGRGYVPPRNPDRKG